MRSSTALLLLFLTASVACQRGFSGDDLVRVTPPADAPEACEGLCVPESVQMRFDQVQDAQTACVAVEDSFEPPPPGMWKIADVALGGTDADGALLIDVTAAHIHEQGSYNYPGIALQSDGPEVSLAGGVPLFDDETRADHILYGIEPCGMLTATFGLSAQPGETVSITAIATLGFGESFDDEVTLKFIAP